MTAPQEPAVVIYSTPFCGYCSAAKRLLERKGVTYTEIDVLREPGRRSEMLERARRQTVPQIFIGDDHVGGYDELRALENRGELDARLETAMDLAHSP